MKKSIIILGLIISVFTGYAQKSENSNYSIGLFGTGGVHFFSNISSVNSALKGNGLPQLLNHVPAYHSGIAINLNRFLLQFSTRTYDLPVKEKEKYELNAIGEGYEVKFGYDLLASCKVDIYPYIGLGAHEFNWAIDNKTPVSLNDALKTMPFQSYQLSVENEQIASVGIIVDVCLFNFSKERFKFLVGGDVHYLYSNNGRWYINNQFVNVGNADLSGFSMTLNFTLKAQLDKFLH